MSSSSSPFSLHSHPVHLGLGARVLPLPAFTGPDWYADYAERTIADGAEGRLVSIHTFSQPWDAWEMHPHGEELVACLAGTLQLIQLIEDREVFVLLRPGEAIINPASVWHTADLPEGGTATALFITAGLDTQSRPRT